MPADAGIKFGQYVLLRRIARGGMAEVFLAQQRGLEGFDRRVAVKRILPHLADSSDFVRMFLAEAKLAAQLSHPNIVHIYEFGKVDHDYFIAMEYVEGVHAGQLFRHIETEKLSPTLIARLGADAANALNYAHELRGANGKPVGLVHRDVSPANIMISYDGIVKLCDFGIAKAAAVSDQLTNPGQVKGKYAYMSPEQTIAQPLDGRSDVFSLAIVLWELLAGRFLVPRGDAVAAMRAIRDGKIEPLAQVAPNTPAPLVSAVSWALENKRDKRATAAQLAQTLEAYIKSSPEIATSMQLAAWVRQRFQREATGQLPSLTAGPGTAAAPGTVAGTATPPSTTPALVTPNSIIAMSRSTAALEDPPGTVDSGTHIFVAPGALAGDGIDGDTLKRVRPNLRPSAEMTIDKAMFPTPSVATLVDEPNDNETILEKPRFAPASGPTVIDAAVHGADAPTVLAKAPRIAPMSPPPPSGDDLGATIQRSRTNQPIPPPLTANTVPGNPGSQPRPAPSAAHAQQLAVAARRPRPQAVDRSRQRRISMVVAAAGLIGLALISFLVALAASGSHAAPPPFDDAAAVPLDAHAVHASVPSDAVIADAAPADAPSATGADNATEAFLEVSTFPAGGTVRVGDQSRVAPAQLVVTAGAIGIDAELDGYAPLHRNETIEAGEHKVIELAFTHKLGPTHGPGTGKLTIRTSPYADVYENGKKIGETPFADRELPAGTHILTFKNPLHPTVTKKIVITAGKPTKLNFDLP